MHQNALRLLRADPAIREVLKLPLTAETPLLSIVDGGRLRFKVWPSSNFVFLCVCAELGLFLLPVGHGSLCMSEYFHESSPRYTASVSPFWCMVGHCGAWTKPSESEVQMLHVTPHIREGKYGLVRTTRYFTGQL